MKELFSAVFANLPREEERLAELEELLEYPEIQADKGEYLTLLREYEGLKNKVADKRMILDYVDEYEKRPSDDPERTALYDKAVRAKEKLCFAEGETETVRYAVTWDGEIAGSVAKKLFSLAAGRLAVDPAPVVIQSTERDLSFVVRGKRALYYAVFFIGRHKVRTDKRTETFVVTAVLEEPEPTFPEEEFSFASYHSSGAGGQNINKVETAIRVVHLPTGLTMTCQDERSQIKNKRRALENIRKKLRQNWEKAQKERIDAERRLQRERREAFWFDEDGVLFSPDGEEYGPLSEQTVSRYIEREFLKAV